jgi:hypothetical protein
VLAGGGLVVEVAATAPVAAEGAWAVADGGVSVPVAAEVGWALAGGGVAALVAAAAVCVTAEAAEVTVLVTDDAAAGAAGCGVLAGGGVAEAGGVAEEVGWAAGGVVAPAAGVLVGGGVAAEGAGLLAGGGVAAEVTVLVAAVAVWVADVTVEVIVPVREEPDDPVPGGVAACAWRENTSKRTRIPAAKTATCATRRATRRKASCGMIGSAQGGTGPDTTAHHQSCETITCAVFSISCIPESLRTRHVRHFRLLEPSVAVASPRALALALGHPSLSNSLLSVTVCRHVVSMGAARPCRAAAEIGPAPRSNRVPIACEDEA